MRLFNFLSNQPWAITEDFARRMVEIYFTALDRKARGEAFDKTALEKELGRPLDNTRAVTVRDGVATITVEGPIFRRADMFTEISNATTVEALARDLNAALNDSKISSIIFYVDSPGGEVNGTNEFSNMIFESRSQKKIVAYVANWGASGAYWIASAASEIVIDATGAVGSIGVVATVPDPTKENKRYIEFVSSQSPNKRPDPTTEAGKTEIQNHVDDLARVFIETVARNRNVTPETVVKDFGAGGLLVGEKAVKAGMADRVGSYEQVLAELSGSADGPNKRPSLSGNGDNYMSTEAKGSLWQKIKAALSPDEQKEFAKLMEPEDETAEIKELRSKAAEADKYQDQIRAGRLKEAETFAGGLVVSKVLLPAKKEAVQQLYAQLAQDDAVTPLAQGSRVESFKAMFDGLPKHNLTTEQMAAELPTGSVALNPDPSEDASLKADEANIRKWAERQNPKPVATAAR